MTTNRIREIRKQKKVTLEQLSEAVSISQPQLTRMETGSRNVSLKKLEIIANALGVSPQDLISNEARMIPVVGYVGAGSVVHLNYSDVGVYEEIKGLDDATEKTAAVKIKGDCLGEFLDGWYAFYDDEPREPTPDMIGELCICWLEDGRVLIKKLMKGTELGFFTLRSNDAPIYDVIVDKAVVVKSMRRG
jgi:Predicted transcriptional regulators